MKHVKKQTGLTLIEVLATLVILSIVTIMITNVFSSGLRYSSQAKETTLLQQEANYLLTLLKEKQQNEEYYEVSVAADHHAVTIKTKDARGDADYSNTVTIENEKLTYQLFDIKHPDSVIDAATETIIIEPAYDENFHVKIIMTSEKDPSLTYQIKTILARL